MSKIQEQKYATRKFNVLHSAEGFKQKVQSQCEIRVYKNGQFGVRFKVDPNIPKVDKQTRKIIFTKSNHICHDITQL
jgi:hypothetical protein